MTLGPFRALLAALAGFLTSVLIAYVIFGSAWNWGVIVVIVVAVASTIGVSFLRAPSRDLRPGD